MGRRRCQAWGRRGEEQGGQDGEGRDSGAKQGAAFWWGVVTTSLP
ncbi:hypothetical protein KR76_00138 [Pimelobacter simplex]|uniref:Uncharacterized protein n=1 Tax=Nocardioides simplex TaxID=2045 RepID=A0A0C5XCX4_NOCSI|nr:hypothetical protein KR76_00138 [Pimelobacter simplex]